jgi:hypothetical protein
MIAIYHTDPGAPLFLACITMPFVFLFHWGNDFNVRMVLVSSSVWAQHIGGWATTKVLG